jgi:thiopeptide-type bacteriocin biosynthesis protein
MPADQLTRDVTPSDMADGVLAVLAGTPMSQVAGRLRVRRDDLAEAVELYKAAGRLMLEDHAAGDWYQVRVQWRDWESAEWTAAVRFGPRLDRLRDTGALGAWWFIRKAPCWRLRLRPGLANVRAELTASVSSVLDELVAAGHVERWWENIYEPEEAAFGGPLGISAAHDLFEADSRAILEYLRRLGSGGCGNLTIGRRELSMLLCSTLMRAAGQEWHEQGDIWLRVARMRSPASSTSDYSRPVAGKLMHLMTVSTQPVEEPFGKGGRLSFTMPWFAAFADAGRQLGAAASHGTLQRGVRDVLAHHVIFHWNRLGLSTKEQSVLASAAFDVILNPPDGTDNLVRDQ